MLLAQQRLFASQFDYADSRYNYVTDLLALKQATGTLNEADLEEVNEHISAEDTVDRLDWNARRAATN